MDLWAVMEEGFMWFGLLDWDLLSLFGCFVTIV